jgi:hypothetical protein
MRWRLKLEKGRKHWQTQPAVKERREWGEERDSAAVPVKSSTSSWRHWRPCQRHFKHPADHPVHGLQLGIVDTVVANICQWRECGVVVL